MNPDFDSNPDEETKRRERLALEWAAMEEESPEDLPPFWQQLIARGRDKISAALAGLKDDLRKDGPINFRK